MADFGLSRKIAEASNSVKKFGIIPYMDPKMLDDQNQCYKLNKKSDVYSIGILMWQISSGYQPYYTKGTEYNMRLALDIINGKREEIINDTPFEYSFLYQGKIFK